MCLCRDGDGCGYGCVCYERDGDGYGCVCYDRVGSYCCSCHLCRKEHRGVWLSEGAIRLLTF